MIHTRLKFIGREKVFVIAEIGGNHEGDFDYARRLCSAATESGADAVKFQTYRADRIVSAVESPERHAHFKKFELSYEQFKELAEIVTGRGKIFMSSLWDTESLRELDSIIPIHKVGSGDVTNWPLLRALARTNKPLIISTAMSTLEEIRECVAFVRESNPALLTAGKLALLHCVAMYGEPKDEYAHLSAMRTLQEAFPDLPIGYSDHTVGTYACEVAASMGAQILEIHFTDDTQRAFRDHALSVTKEELTVLRERLDRIESLLGSPNKTPVANIETPERIREFRRALYLTRDCAKGTTIDGSVLTTLRPNIGIDARRYFDFVGRKLRVSRKAFEHLREEDFEPTS